ncbi:MAG: NAD-dependent epimerase/dehydratase family protein, partial [Sedimentisphaerales bacterium]
MNILVTGFSGNLGRAVVKSLIQNGHKLRVLLHGSAFYAQEFDLDVEIIWGSLSDHQLFEQLT